MINQLARAANCLRKPAKLEGCKRHFTRLIEKDDQLWELALVDADREGVASGIAQ